MNNTFQAYIWIYLYILQLIICLFPPMYIFCNASYILILHENVGPGPGYMSISQLYQGNMEESLRIKCLTLQSI